MKTSKLFMKKILFLAITALFFSLAACDDDDHHEKRNTNFDVPELTSSNTIRFSVKIMSNNHAYVYLHGGKIAIDWGDGETTKDINPQDGESWRSEFTHVYKQTGEYEIKIWSDEITMLSIASPRNSHEQLQIGNCPFLKEAIFSHFLIDETLNLNGCKKLTKVYISNWDVLESIELDECSELDEITLENNSCITSLDISKHANLHLFTAWNCPELNDFELPTSIVGVDCRGIKTESFNLENYKELRTFNINDCKELSSLSLTNCDKLSVLSFSDTQIESFDISAFPNLSILNCSNTLLTDIDVSTNEALGYLQCKGLNLTTLNITNNPNLRRLDCSDNQLTSLDISNATMLRYLHINDNQFEKEELEAIFKILPDFRSPTTKSDMKLPGVTISNNPGTEVCNTNLIWDKGWMIMD